MGRLPWPQRVAWVGLLDWPWRVLWVGWVGGSLAQLDKLVHQLSLGVLSVTEGGASSIVPETG